VDKRPLLAQIIEAQIEKARSLAIDNSDAQRRLRTKQRSQRFQLQARLKINFCSAEPWRQLEFLPQFLCRTRKYSASSRMSRPAHRGFKHMIEIVVEPSVLALPFCLFQRLLDDILGEDRFTPMRPVLRRIGLKVKAQCVNAFFLIGAKRSQ